jgi:hypothetical protein
MQTSTKRTLLFDSRSAQSGQVITLQPDQVFGFSTSVRLVDETLHTYVTYLLLLRALH